MIPRSMKIILFQLPLYLSRQTHAYISKQVSPSEELYHPFSINNELVKSILEEEHNPIMGECQEVLDHHRIKTQHSSLELSPSEESIKTSITFSAKTPPKIIIMGGPASGKGTQCERIAERYDVIHLSTGDMLREAVKRGNRIGVIAKRFMDRGELVPDNIIIQIVLERISEPDCLQKGWLLDGFPRTQRQAQALTNVGVDPDIFLYLNVPDSQLIERVVGRRLDPESGKIYHLKFFPPPAEAASRLIQRSDDTEEKMQNRLRQFHTNAESVRRRYRDKLVEVNGATTPDRVANSIFQAIDEKSALAKRTAQ